MRSTILKSLSLAGILVGALLAPAVLAGTGPEIYSVVEGRDPASSKPLVIITGVIVVMEKRDNSFPSVVLFLLVGLGCVALLGYQVWLLSAQGQTIGKRCMGLRIVRVKDLSNGGFITNVLLRGGVSALINIVPVVGTLYSLADPLFIFREDRRCLHDHIAGTCVIKADAVVQ